MTRKLNNSFGFAPLIILLVLALIIVIGAGAFYFGTKFQLKEAVPVKEDLTQNQGNVSQDQQSAINERFGVIFTVPGNWYVKENDSRIFHYEDAKGVTLAEVGTQDRDFSSIKEASPGAELTQIGSRNAYKFQDTYIFPLGIKEKQILRLTFYIKDQKIVDQVLNKLEFKEESKIDYHDYWETYQDKVNGYSFKYPAYFNVEEVKDDTSVGVNVLKKNSGIKSKFAGVPDDVVITYRLFDGGGLDSGGYAEKFQKDLKPMIDSGELKINGTTTRKANSIERQEVDVSYKDDRGVVEVYFMDLKGKILEIKLYEANYNRLEYNLSSLLYQVMVRTKFD